MVLALLLLNLCFISAYIVSSKFGTVTLSPGEKYTFNIPFIWKINQSIPPESINITTICGKASLENGTSLKDIKVIAKYYNNATTLTENTTKSNGRFCLTIQAITSSEKLDIYVEYDNSTIILGSNEYDLNFDNYKKYNKSMDKYAVLTGDIENEDAEIENGRFEINLKYNETGKFTYSKDIFDYQVYYLNISRKGLSDYPNSQLNVSWRINSSTQVGTYKFYIKTSFNGEEKTTNVYFNVSN